MKENSTKIEGKLKPGTCKVLEGKEVREVGHLRDPSTNTNHTDLATVLHSKSAKAGKFEY